MHRIVVTGMGAVSPLACGVEQSWRRLLAGQSGLRPLPEWAQALPARIAGRVPDKADDAEGGFDPAEACIDIVSLGGFAAARALSSGFNDEPARASRPFDRNRDGFVMGEGAGILVIEELEHALARGAAPIAEIVGYGTTADAYHMTSGPPDGDGARRAMEIALRQANLAPPHVLHLI